MGFENIVDKFPLGSTYYYKFIADNKYGVLKVINTNPLELVFPTNISENDWLCDSLKEPNYIWSPSAFHVSALLDVLNHPRKQPYKIYYKKENKKNDAGFSQNL